RIRDSYAESCYGMTLVLHPDDHGPLLLLIEITEADDSKIASNIEVKEVVRAVYLGQSPLNQKMVSCMAAARPAVSPAGSRRIYASAAELLAVSWRSLFQGFESNGCRRRPFPAGEPVLGAGPGGDGGVSDPWVSPDISF